MADALSIRGVCPRGLIEATDMRATAKDAIEQASAGSAPAASLKRCERSHTALAYRSIRGVCPRGLIEASTRSGTLLPEGRIRGVCPRGLIEAGCRELPDVRERRHPRGLPPRPH